jgi:hypothetical protein
MKRILLYLFVLTGCNTVKNSADLQGVYTCDYQNEFYRTHDTLVVQNIRQDMYRIERRTNANQKKKIEKWTLQYDTEKQILTEIKKGKFLLWYPDKQLIIYGNRNYQKLK